MGHKSSNKIKKKIIQTERPTLFILLFINNKKNQVIESVEEIITW